MGESARVPENAALGEKVDTVEDADIITLFQNRDERALRETRGKYEALCMTVACNILGSREDAEEIFSDALLHLWEAIPPAVPASLGAYLLTAVRNAARDRLSYRNAERRGSGVLTAAVEELSEVLPSAESGDKILDGIILRDALARFLQTLSPEPRAIFLRRYWLCLSIAEVAEMTGCTVGKVNMSLARTRRKLKAFLEKEELL